MGHGSCGSCSVSICSTFQAIIYTLDGGSLYMEVRAMISGPWIMWKLFRKYMQYLSSYCLHPRWWQPIYGGEGHDQWAMDHVEIVP